MTKGGGTIGFAFWFEFFGFFFCGLLVFPSLLPSLHYERTNIARAGRVCANLARGSHAHALRLRRLHRHCILRYIIVRDVAPRKVGTLVKNKMKLALLPHSSSSGVAFVQVTPRRGAGGRGGGLSRRTHSTTASRNERGGEEQRERRASSSSRLHGRLVLLDRDGVINVDVAGHVQVERRRDP
jgi:hypothetical protein